MTVPNISEAPGPGRNAVCLCVDRRMLVPALFVAQGVLSHAGDAKDAFDIVIVAEPSEIDDLARRWMEVWGMLWCRDIDMARLRGLVDFHPRLSMATLVKLVLPDHFAGRYEKILYLDADLSIHGDVSALFRLDTGAFAVAAVPSGRRWPAWMASQAAQFAEHAGSLGMTPPYRFINTGVLLFDVAKWNRDRLSALALDYIRRNAGLCYLPDEHGLNAVLDGRQAELSPIWNMTPRVWREPALRELVEPAIIHYAGGDKPWKKYGFGKRLLHDRPAYRLYEAFLRDSPWPDWLATQWTLNDLRLNVVWEMKILSRRLRRKASAPPSRRQLHTDHEAARQYLADQTFADVEQGIVVRTGGRFRLKGLARPGRPASRRGGAHAQGRRG
jgi:lipopolysaccharide biosynthesis glycosyltransferase